MPDNPTSARTIASGAFVLLVQGMGGAATRCLQSACHHDFTVRQAKTLTVSTVLRWQQERPNEKLRWSCACKADHCGIRSADFSQGPPECKEVSRCRKRRHKECRIGHRSGASGQKEQVELRAGGS